MAADLVDKLKQLSVMLFITFEYFYQNDKIIDWTKEKRYALQHNTPYCFVNWSIILDQVMH